MIRLQICSAVLQTSTLPIVAGRVLGPFRFGLR
jgi:hypothetical protein